MEPNLKTDILLRHIENNDLEKFLVEWSIVKNQLNEKEKQELLVTIIENYFEDDEFPYFKKVLDKIIESKVSLNFSIEHWAPTFLCLAVNVFSRDLFDYFLRNSAKLNYVGDEYIAESEETIKREVEEDVQRYSTCLDFAGLKMADMLTVDFNCREMSWDKLKDFNLEELVGDITISKRDYLELLEQSKYLHDLIKLDGLIDHIKSLGGKEYSELKEERKARK